VFGQPSDAASSSSVTLDKTAFAELKASIAKNGLIQPIAVRAVGEGYEVASATPSLTSSGDRFARLMFSARCVPVCRRGIYGARGIRTLDTVARMPDFKSGAFNRSATAPLFCLVRSRRSRISLQRAEKPHP
jgi:hypothetical protein